MSLKIIAELLKKRACAPKMFP